MTHISGSQGDIFFHSASFWVSIRKDLALPCPGPAERHAGLAAKECSLWETEEIRLALIHKNPCPGLLSVRTTGRHLQGSVGCSSWYVA